MIAPDRRSRVPAGFVRLHAGDITRTGQVAGARRPSLECERCGALVVHHAPTVAAHRRKRHQVAA